MDIYMKIFLENKMEMTIRRNDLAVFSFMLKLVKCKKAAAFAQLDEQPGAQVCENAGLLELHFDDKKLEAEVESKMTPSARGAINEFLAQMNAAETKKATALLQIDKGDQRVSCSNECGRDQESNRAPPDREGRLRLGGRPGDCSQFPRCQDQGEIHCRGWSSSSSCHHNGGHADTAGEEGEGPEGGRWRAIRVQGRAG